MAKKERTIGAGTYTEAGFNAFIKSALRRASGRWKPKTLALSNARIEKGVYRCAKCEQAVPVTKVVDGKRVKWVEVDHLIPVVPPDVGFTTWDSFIERLFVEVEGLRVLCRDCHSEVTKEQNDVAKQRRSAEKERTNE